MSERFRPRETLKKEVLTTGVLLGTGLAILTYLSMHGFSKATKMEAFHRQGCRCVLCGGQHRKWGGHHFLPQSEGGKDDVENCGMAGDDRARDCHEVLDREAIDHGMIFDPATRTFVHVSQLPPERFKNERVRQKTLRRFSVGEAIAGTIRFVADQIEHLAPEPIMADEPEPRGHERGQRKHKHGKKPYRGQGRRH